MKKVGGMGSESIKDCLGDGVGRVVNQPTTPAGLFEDFSVFGLHHNCKFLLGPSQFCFSNHFTFVALQFITGFW